MSDKGNREREHLYDQQPLLSGIEPELDLRNVNFATGENHYINEYRPASINQLHDVEDSYEV
ncbi:hypothetical protein LCL95_11535 [Bacillus timonensis]|nr:hypothetical protein [Bacillus timonensis]